LTAGGGGGGGAGFLELHAQSTTLQMESSVTSFVRVKAVKARAPVVRDPRVPAPATASPAGFSRNMCIADP
jgi:hypothetical protein